MDLEHTRQIPMWQASPFLPIGVGLALFVLLAVLTLVDHPGAAPSDVAGVDSSRLAPTHRTAGAPALPEGAEPVTFDMGEALRKGRSGQYLEALQLFEALPPERRKMFAEDLTRYRQSAAEVLLFKVERGKLEREEALEKLRALLDIEGMDEHPLAPKLRAKLTELIEAAEGG